MAISRILSGRSLDLDDHLSHWPRNRGTNAREPQSAVIDRRYSNRGATIPEDNGPAVLPLFCLAPHGVFPASQITPRAVSSYLAFSPLPVQRTGGVFSVTLSVATTFQSRRPRILRGMPPYGVRTFLQQIPHSRIHQRSSAISR